MEQHQDRVTAKAEKAERCWCRKEQREEEREKRGGKKMSEWLKKSERVKGRREKMSFKNSKGAFCPFLHHSVLLVLLFRLSKHHWSLIKPELSHLHTHTKKHTQSDGLRWLEGGYFHRAFKNDLQTPWPHSAKSPETLMETIWGFSVIWQTAYLAPASPFSTHFEWNGQIEFEAARKDLFSSVVCVCVRMCVRVFTAGGGLLCRCSLVSRQF